MPATQTVTLDLHVHTNYSHDGRDSVEKVVESAIAKKLDGIAICDHNTMDGFYAARQYVADNNRDLIIIPGIEVSTSLGHVLVLGLDKRIEKEVPLEETIRKARQQENEKNETVLIIAPHPFHPFRHSIGTDCTHPGIDAIEVFNSRYFFGTANARASRTAVRHQIAAVAGSDAHSAEFVGLATVEVEINVAETHNTEQEAILKQIKEGKVRIANCKRTPFWIFFSQLFKKTTKRQA